MSSVSPGMSVSHCSLLIIQISLPKHAKWITGTLNKATTKNALFSICVFTLLVLCESKQHVREKWRSPGELIPV